MARRNQVVAVGGLGGSLLVLSWWLDWLDRSQAVVATWPTVLVVLRPVAEFVLSATGQASLLVALILFVIVIKIQDRRRGNFSKSQQRRITKARQSGSWRIAASDNLPLVVAAIAVLLGAILWA